MVLHTLVYVKSAETKKATIWLPIRFLRDGAGERDFEPLHRRRKNLNLVRLPISPLPQSGINIILIGVADGARTHDNRNHNPGLYQLSYSHQKDYINQC